MVDKMLPYIEEGKSIVAVIGVGHMDGVESLLAQHNERYGS